MKKRLLSSFLRLQMSYLGRLGKKFSSENWFFRRKQRFRARKSRELKRKAPRKRWILPPKWPKWTKKGGFGEEITGRGSNEKMGFTTDFAMLWSSKMGANEFFSHFFSVKSCREWRNALPLHSQSGSNALARESYALKATRQQKCCCDLWKSYITDCREVQGTIDHEAFFLSGKKLLRVKWIVPSNSTPKQNKGYRNLSDKKQKTNKYHIYNEEFDPGSGWTLATGLTHASRGAAGWKLAFNAGDRRTGA